MRLPVGRAVGGGEIPAWKESRSMTAGCGYRRPRAAEANEPFVFSASSLIFFPEFDFRMRFPKVYSPWKEHFFLKLGKKILQRGKRPTSSDVLNV